MPGPSPGVWLRAADGWWCSTIRGRQVRLVKKDAGKRAAFDELRKRLDKPEATPLSHVPVAEILTAYLEWVEDPANNRPLQRVAEVRRTLQSFCKFKVAGRQNGELSISTLGPNHAQAWIDGHPKWSSSTKTLRVGIVRAGFNWAKRLGKIDRQPLGKVHGPGYERREVIPSSEDIDALLAYPNEAWSDLLTALVNTGCRPSEVSRVTAAHVDIARKCWTLREHKTKGKVQRARVVWLNAEMLRVTKRLMKKHPTGPLFRNSYGRAWNANTVVDVFRKLRRECDLSGHITAYSLRHEYVTRALTKGLDVTTVAEMTGTSPKMIWKHYAHLLTNPKHMLAAVEKAGR